MPKLDRKETPYLIVPGLNGSGPGHWQDFWLLDNANAELVEQEDWARPRATEWLHALEAALLAQPGAILVGHSLGAVLIAKLAASPAAGHVAGAILVAPCDLKAAGVLHPGCIEFGEMPVDPLPFPSLLVSSRNDPYISHRKAERLARLWGSSHVDLGEAGHINVASGFGRWREGYALASAFPTAAVDRNAWERHLASAGDGAAASRHWSAHARETLSRTVGFHAGAAGVGAMWASRGY